MKKFCALIFLFLTVATAIADGPFRAHRFDVFRVMPVQRDNVVFLGNSITNMHVWGEAWGDAKVLNRGVSGATSGEIREHLDDIIFGHPKELYLMIGTNDGMDDMKNIDIVIDNTREILTRLVEETPETKVYLQTLLPSTWNRTIDCIESCNAQLIELVKSSFPMVTIVDTYHAVKGIIEGENSSDRLHISAKAYQMWMEEIQRAGGMKGFQIQYDNTCEGRDYAVGGSNGMRNSYFANLPLMGNDILFIGDEFVNGGEWAELLHNPFVKNRGYSWGYGGMSCKEYLKSLPYIYGVNRKDNGIPQQVILYAGTQNPHDLESYKALVNAILERSSRLILVSIVNDGEELNDFMRQLAQEDDRIDYADIASGMEPYMDGVYVMGKGYLHAAKIIGQVLQEKQLIKY